MKLARGTRDPDESCARCTDTPPNFAVRWPEGPLCATCYHKALWRRGPCTGCGTERQLPGIAADGAALCRDCADVPIDQHCTRCGTEAYLPRRRLCAGCNLDDRLNTLFPGPSPIAGVIDRLRTAESANATIAFLRDPMNVEVLVGLHNGQLDCSHATLDELLRNDARHSGNLRGLLVTSGLLESRDELLDGYTSRAAVTIAAVTHPDSRDLLELYNRWYLAHRLRQRQRAGTLTTAHCKSARQRLVVATQFVAWLAERNRSLSEATQADLDQWLAEGTTTRIHVSPLVRWMRNAGHNTLEMPPPKRVLGTVTLSERRRSELLSQCFNDDATPIDVRVAGLFFLLLALPVTRIVTLSDINFSLDGDELALITDGTPVPLPAAFARLIDDQFTAARHRNTAAHDETGPRWLFPGRRPGTHAQPAPMRKRLRRHGLTPLRPAHNSATAALVRELPATVASTAAGVTTKTATGWATAYGLQYASYPGARRE